MNSYHFQPHQHGPTLQSRIKWHAPLNHLAKSLARRAHTVHSYLVTDCLPLSQRHTCFISRLSTLYRQGPSLSPSPSPAATSARVRQRRRRPPTPTAPNLATDHRAKSTALIVNSSGRWSPQTRPPENPAAKINPHARGGLRTPNQKHEQIKTASSINWRRRSGAPEEKQAVPYLTPRRRNGGSSELA